MDELASPPVAACGSRFAFAGGGGRRDASDSDDALASLDAEPVGRSARPRAQTPRPPGRARSETPCAERNRSEPAGTSRMPMCAACSSTVSPAATSEFSTLSAEFSRCSGALVLERAPDAGVQLQQAELHRHDPDQRERDEPDPRAAVDQTVEQRMRRDDRRRMRLRASAPTLGGRRAGPPAACDRSRDTRRGRRARRGAAAAAAGDVPRAPPRRPRRGGRRSHAAEPASLAACGRRAGARRRSAGLLAISPAEGTIERRVSNAASGVRPHRAHGQVGRADAAPRARDQEALDAAILERLKADPGQHAAVAQQPPRERQRRSSCSSSSLTAMRSAWKERLAGCPPAKRAGAGIAETIVSTSSWVVSIGALLAAAHDRAGDRARVALLAEVAQRPRQPALVPGGDYLARGELLVGVHAHVQRRVDRSRRTRARARPPASRTCPGRSRRCRRALPPRPAPQGLGVARADEPHGAGHLARQLLEALGRVGVAVDRDQRAFGAEALGDQLRVAAAAERAVDRGLARARVEQVDQLAGEHRDVGAGGHVVKR